jgi:glycerophosphoryl diester phosphodiesterase
MEIHPPQVPRVIGHRGAAGHAPENTIASLKVAAALGARWVEFDVKLAGGGEPILFHDDTLDRTTDGHGPVATTPLAQIKSFDAGKWYQAPFAGERVPTLDEALVVLARFSLGANVEIKPCPGRERETAERALAELERLWPRTRPEPLVSSFSPDSLKTARARSKTARLGLLLDEYRADWRDLAKAIDAQSVNISDQGAKADWIGAIKESGYGLLVYTVNDPRRADELFGLGVDGVFTDAPARILAGVSKWL